MRNIPIVCILESCWIDFGFFYVCIDAVDLIPQGELDSVLSRLRLVSYCVVKIFVTRHSCSDITTRLQYSPIVEFQAPEEEMKAYVGSRLKDSYQSAPLHSAITQIVSHSRQNYLVATLLLNLCRGDFSSLPVLDTQQDIEVLLQSLYEEAVQNIKRQPSSMAEMAIRALYWVSHAKDYIGNE
jgi:hypothetical protein